MKRRSKKRTNLAVFVTDRLDGPLRAVVASGGGEEEIASAVYDVLQSPVVSLRANAAGPQERAALMQRLPDIILRLSKLDARKEAGMTLGTTVTQRMAAEASADPRDAFTAQEREMAYAALHAARQETSSPPVRWRDRELWMVHSDIGSGKGLVAAHMASTAYRQGRDVFQ